MSTDLDFKCNLIGIHDKLQLANDSWKSNKLNISDQSIPLLKAQPPAFVPDIVVPISARYSNWISMVLRYKVGAHVKTNKQLCHG